jgi:prefoldin alpha subunit
MPAENNQQNSDESAYAQLRYMQNVYSQQYELIEEQIASYSVSLDAVRKGAAFLGSSKQANKSKTLISVGGGAYIEATLPEIKTTLVYIGSGYLVEKSVLEAKEFIEANQKNQEVMLNKLDAERKKLQNELISIAYKMESMQQGRQQV